MANKRRPKKARLPYRRYGPGTKEKDEDEEEDEVEMNGYAQSGSTLSKKESVSVSVSPSAYGYTTTLTHDSLSHSAYPPWPVSQFQKIDVLKYALLNEKLKSGQLVEIPISFQTEQPFLVPEEQCMVFPAEIYQLILNYVEKKNPKYLRVCKMWYRIYVEILYRAPVLHARNFYKFVETITTPKNRIGSNVRVLDLSTIIQSGKNSYVSKLLRRCSENLQVFVAPQTSFGYAPLVSLRGCTKIQLLDLGFVSETVNLRELFQSISNAKDLTKLSFPRSSIACDECDSNVTWPPNLSSLRLSGGINDKFITDSVFPSTIKRLEFAHCPLLTELGFYNMLSKYGQNITHLSVQYPMPKLNDSSMDFVFTYCPNLVFLQVAVDYCSRSLFTEELLPKLAHGRALKTLCIESSGALGQSGKIHPDDLTIALMEDRLPSLKSVSVTSKLGWDVNGDDVADLVNLLEENDGGLYLNHH